MSCEANSPVRPRIVSLLSSATEILHSLGALPYLVGRSHECDFPPEILGLPCCTQPLIDIHADSQAIDRQVKDSARAAISLYRVFDDVLERLQPTHILTQVQCDVCAVSLKDVEQSIASSLLSNPAIVSLNPACLAEIWNDFRRIGHSLQIDPEPAIARILKGIAAVRRQPSGLRVACVEWIEPLMAAGNWTPELIEIAGGVNLFGSAGQHSPWLQWHHLVAAKPDVTIVAPCGFDLHRTQSELHWLTNRPDFSALGRVYIADGNAWFNRPGPRILETLQIIVEILYQETDNFRNFAWKAVSNYQPVLLGSGPV